MAPVILRGGRAGYQVSGKGKIYWEFTHTLSLVSIGRQNQATMQNQYNQILMEYLEDRGYSFLHGTADSFTYSNLATGHSISVKTGNLTEKDCINAISEVLDETGDKVQSIVFTYSQLMYP